MRYDKKIFGAVMMQKLTGFMDVFMTMDATRLKNVIGDVAEGLNFLHRQVPPIIHRDIKPDNIMIYQAGKIWNVVITDFNTCATGQGPRNTVIYTQGYGAPEIFTGCYDHRADTFSLGVTIKEWAKMYMINDREIMQLAEKMCNDDPG